MPCCGAATTLLPAPQAALVNGTASHALELDDFGGCGHSGAVVVPVVCALVGRGGISGREALMGLLAGYDLAARVLEGAGGYRPHNDLGWHSTGTCGSFGAAAAAARMLQTRRALASPMRSASPAPSPAASGHSWPTAP